MGLIVVLDGERTQRLVGMLLMMVYTSLAAAPTGGPYPAPATQDYAMASYGGPTTLAPSSAAEAIASGGGNFFVSLLATIVGCVVIVAIVVLALVCYLRQRWGKRRGPEAVVEQARSGSADKFPSSVLPSIGSFEELEGDGGRGQVTSNPLYASSGRSIERPLSASARTAIGTDCGGDFKDVEDGSPIADSSALSNWSSLGWKSTTAPVAPKGKGISRTVKGNCGSSSTSSSGRGNDSVGVGVSGRALPREAGDMKEFTRKKKKMNATTEMLDTVGPAFLIRPPPWPDRGDGISGWRDSGEGGCNPWSSASTITRGRRACRAASPTNSYVGSNSDNGGRAKTTSRSVSRGSSNSSPRSLHDFGGTNGGSKRPNLERVLSDSGRYFPHRAQPLAREGRTSSSSSSASRWQREGNGSGDCGEASIPTRAAERVVATAGALSRESIIPLVRESAVVATALARIATERHGKAREIERRVRWCRALVRMLERAGEVLGQATAHDGETERLLLEDVRECVADVMEIIRACKSTTSGLSKVFDSTLCTRRRMEADEAIDIAQQRLEVIMQVRAGNVNVVNTLGQHGDSGNHRQEKTLKDIVARSKKKRRQHKLDRLEISADDIDVTDEVLGSGGFGTVYLADYNGLNAAAKVVVLDADTEAVEYRDQSEGAQGACEEHLRKWSEEEYSDRASSGDGEQRALSEARRCQVFLREVEALKRMRDPNVIEIFGGVVAVKDCLILVMELLPAGSLRHRLKKARRGLSERALRQIVLDMCSGMAYLHSQAFLHGSLKSSNVLFDATGRAKISDYGALLWAQHTPKLETCSGAQNGSIGVNLRWSAPEILNREPITQKTDVYSFGMVVWECLTRQLPWADLAGVDMLLLAVTGGERPTIPPDAPANLAALTKVCWSHDPASRPAFKRILVDLGQTEKGVGNGVGVGGGTSSSASLWPWSAWSSTPGAGEVSDSGTPKTAAGERTASPESLQVLNAAARAARSDSGNRGSGGGGGAGGGIFWPFVLRRKTDSNSRSLNSFPVIRRGVCEKASKNEGQGSGGSAKLDEPPMPDRDLPALFRRLQEEKAQVNSLSSGEDSPLEPQPVIER